MDFQPYDFNNKQTKAESTDTGLSDYPRDPTYYFEDGSTILLVGGVLFKVIAIFERVVTLS